MINLKKYAALTAACLLALSSLTACSSQTDTVTEQQSTEQQTTEASQAAAGSSETEETEATESETEFTPAEYEMASLSGPTTMGMVKMMSDSDNGLTLNTYNVTIHSTSDEIVTGIVSGTTDIANVPANLASVLYNKTDGAIKITDVNTLGVLYAVTVGEEITSISDLAGKTVYSTGKGTAPEYVMNYILRANGLEPQEDVTIEYKSESAEVAAVMAESENAIAVLPQPYVTVAMTQNSDITIALSLTDEWDKVCDTLLITGVTIAQGNVIEENPAAFEVFMEDYAASVEYVNDHIDEAAALVGDYGIVTENVAINALPYCNITFLTGEEMRSAVSGYLNVLFEADASSVGGAVPADSAYYG